MSEKIEKTTSPETKNAIVDVDGQAQDEGEVFQTDVEGQNYRTVSWSVQRLQSDINAECQVSNVRSNVQGFVFSRCLVDSQRFRLCRRRSRCTTRHWLGQLQHLCSFPTWVLQAETSKHPCESISLTFHRRYTLMTGSPRHGVCCWRCLVSRSHWSSLHSWVGIHLQSAHTQRD
jgi:hypothetical protein